MQRFYLADDRCFFVCAEKQSEELLAVSVYDASMAKEGLDTPAMIVYFSKESFINRLYNKEAGCYEWRTGCLYKYFPYLSSRSLMDIQAKASIADFFGAADKWEQVIESFQEGILAVRLKAKYKLMTDKIDAQMTLVPALPNRFMEYAGTRAMPQRYFFYEYAKRKQLKGFCTNCRQSVMVKEPRHNQFGKCPACGATVQFKSHGRVKHFIYDEGGVCLPQKIRGGFVLRYFETWRKEYPHGVREVYHHEIRRCLYVDGKIEQFLYDKFRHSGIVRWCDCDDGFFRYDRWLYPVNLEKIVEGTPWQFSSPSIYRKALTKPCLSHYFKLYLEHPYLENLLKNGFNVLIRDMMDDRWNPISVDAGKRKLHELLKISKRGLKLLQEMQTNTDHLRNVQRLEEAGIRNYDVPFINDLATVWKHHEKQYIEAVLPRTSHYKATRYAKTLSSFEKNDWLDYIRMASEVGYDMRKEHALFPRDLKKAHDTATWAHRAMAAKTSEAEFALHIPRLKAREWQTEASPYQVIAPKTAVEIVNEGHRLNHCVHSYIKSVIEGRCEIMFLRQKDKPKKSYVTLEIKGQVIQQYRGANNKTPPEDVCKFVKDYGAWLSKTPAFPLAA